MTATIFRWEVKGDPFEGTRGPLSQHRWACISTTPAAASRCLTTTRPLCSLTRPQHGDDLSTVDQHRRPTGQHPLAVEDPTRRHPSFPLPWRRSGRLR